MHLARRTLSAVAATLATLLAGCNAALTPTPAASVIAVNGNWQFASTASAAARLPVLTGMLSGGGSSIKGLLHANAASSCLTPSTILELSGSADAMNVITLTAANVASGTLTLTGTLSPDGKSLTNAAYSVTGGTCAMPRTQATATSFASITGHYVGNFSDAQGQVLTLAADLTQSPASNTSGDFLLSGTATLPNNPCFTSPASITNSQVSGGTFQLTYSDPATGNAVDTTGTFAPDGLTLTVTRWALSGSCGTDSGSGTMTRQ